MLLNNLIANFIGQGWRAAMNLVFIPIYIDYLGVEAYGVIGFYAILQVTLGLIENGLNPALGREMARYGSGQHSPESIRETLRTIEISIALLALCVIVIIVSASTWLAQSWLQPDGLSEDVVQYALIIMAWVLGFRFLENTYSASLFGLQHHVRANLVLTIMATVRGAGAVMVLAFIDASLEAFFLWQLLSSMVTMIWLKAAVYASLPRVEVPVRFSFSALRGLSAFAGGMVALTAISIISAQLDKILLPRLLGLEALGYYVLAYMVASAVLMLQSPILTAYYPRMTQYFAANQERQLCQSYHVGAQLVNVLAGSVAVLLMIFAQPVILAWTNDSALAEEVAPVLSVLALGVLVQVLAAFPNQLQLAVGWTSLRVRTDLITALLFVPLLFVVVSKYEMLGAAWAWVSLHMLRLLVMVPLMHRKILRKELGYWLVFDIAMPLAVLIMVSGLIRLHIETTGTRLFDILGLALSALLMLITATLSARDLRRILFQIVRRKWICVHA